MARSTTSKPSVSSTKSHPATGVRAKAGAAGLGKRRPIPAPDHSAVTQSASAAKPATDPSPPGPEMKKQELLQKVLTRSGIKKKDAKPVVEAMLEVLGEALANGRELNLQPLGKIKMNRIKEMDRARVIVAKIRQSKNHGTTNPGDNNRGQDNQTLRSHRRCQEFESLITHHFPTGLIKCLKAHRQL